MCLMMLASGVFARSQNTDFSSTNSSSTSGTISTSSFEQTVDSVGGTASVAIGQTGSITGSVSSNGFGGADITLDGSVGTQDNPTSARASSTGTSSTFSQENIFDIWRLHDDFPFDF